jgi:Flp pilus assembly protein TadG
MRQRLFDISPRQLAAALLARLRDERNGVAAVEFALILPLLITLYLGCVELTQGIMASRKVAILSRTLSDLTAQQLTTVTSPCTTASICDAQMSLIFSASAAVMSPFSTANLSSGNPSLTMIVSSVEFVTYTAAPKSGVDKTKVWVPTQNTTAGSFTPTTNDPGYEAVVHWSKAAASPNAGTPRSCATSLTPADNTNAPSLTTLAKGLYGSGALIVADVSYKYDPPFGGSVLAWASAGGDTFISMNNTTYMRPRNWTTYITYLTSQVTSPCTG